MYEKGPRDAFFLVKFWADLNTNLAHDSAIDGANANDPNANPNNSSFYGVTTTYESDVEMNIQCSTKVCSFGKQVVEKLETEYARFENGR